MLLRYRIILLMIMPILLISCKDDHKELPVVQNVEIERYLGKWYEIARLPNSFEKGLICCTAEYTLNEDGSIKVINRGRKEDDLSKEKKATGKAWVADKSETGKLKVSFFWPFSADYWIIDLDEENYDWAVVGHPNRKYFWVLARNKFLPESILNRVFQKAESLGFDMSKVMLVSQECDN